MLKKIIIILYKIFFIGLLLQFFAQTFITFKLGLDDGRTKYIWLRKEVIIGFLLLLSAIGIIREKKRKQLFNNNIIGWRTGGLIIAIIITILIHFQVLNLGLGTYALAFKYDFLGFIILLAGFHSSSFLETKNKTSLLQRYTTLIKYCLIGALIRYFIIFIKPGTLKIFGYDNFSFEGKIGTQPPAAYYNLINHGIIRNQFLFERPISRGFFLIALFPFFFISTLYKKPFRNTRFRRRVFVCNIFLTFSRAARGAWIIELFLLVFFLSKKQLQKILLKFLIPGILFLGLLGTMGYQKYFQRGYSDAGHLQMIRKSIQIISWNPLRGQGGSSSGPGSHWKGQETHLTKDKTEGKEGFNSENQYLQVMVEFGIIGFLGWFFIYLSLNLIGPRILYQHRDEQKDPPTSTLFLLAISLGMIGLSIEGMVLHSFVDRMTVYPFMLLFGIIWMHYYSDEAGENDTPRSRTDAVSTLII